MAVTTNHLMEEMRDRFGLQYIAGQQGGEHVVTWVHLMEDVSASELCVGNELVVTSCYTMPDEESLLTFVEKIQEKPIAGLVINVGKYVREVPKSVIQKCNEDALPLFTMPWEMSAMEFVKRCCAQITKDAQNIERLNQAALNAIQTPYYESGYLSELSDFFDPKAGFQILIVDCVIPKENRRRLTNKASLRIHSVLYQWGFQFLVFQLEKRFVLVLNQKSDDLAQEIAAKILSLFLRRGWVKNGIHLGIGTAVEDVRELSESYHAAASALRRGMALGNSIQHVRDMGFYKLLYSVPDEGILEEYYEQRLAPVLAYDADHGSNYVETLFRYLLSDCSLSAVAKQMYTHRNTVNYRMGKIRELLDNQLLTQQDRFPLVLAFHIGVILEKVPDYERGMNPTS